MSLADESVSVDTLMGGTLGLAFHLGVTCAVCIGLFVVLRGVSE